MYGHDHALGFFVEVFRAGRARSVTSLEFFTDNKPPTLQQCFDFLIDQAFFTRDELEEVLIAIQDDRDVPERLKRVGDVVMGFRG